MIRIGKLSAIFTKLKTLTNSLVLIVAYILGIGITSIISKAIGKKFVAIKAGKSTWVKPDEESSLDRMY